MIIKFYKGNKPAVKIGIFILAAICWLPAFFIPVLPIHYENSLFQLILYQWISNRFLIYVLGVFLLSFQAYVINDITAKHNIYGYENNLPALFYILFMSAISCYWGFHPILFANTFLILGLSRLMKINDQISVNHYVFDAAFLFALAAIFYLPFAVILLLIPMGLIFLRQAKWREFIVGLIGMVMPFFLFYIITFLANGQSFFFDYFHLTAFYTFHLQNLYYYILIAVPVFFMAISYLYYFSSLNKYTIRVRNIYKVVLWLLILQIISLFITSFNYLEIPILLILPASFILPNILIWQKKKLWISEAVLWIFILYSVGFLFLHSGIFSV